MNDYNSMRFIDAVPNLTGSTNLLFRGGMPLDDNGGFDRDGLDDHFHKVHPQTPQLPNYYLVVVSLVYDDDPGLAVERKYFSNPEGNPNTIGQLVWWPTYGSLRCYYQTDPAERDRLVRTFDEWLPDTLIRRTEMLRYMLETSWGPGPLPFNPQYGPRNPNPPPALSPNKPTVFYVHCSGGCDRTSEIIGAYQLRYQGYNWLRMNKELPCYRPDGWPVPAMGCNNYRALQWYAIWLNRTFGFDLAPYGDQGCADPAPPAPGPGPWSPCVPLPPPQR
jgi:hypothetical protein